MTRTLKVWDTPEGLIFEQNITGERMLMKRSRAKRLPRKLKKWFKVKCGIKIIMNK